ncbi:splicing factor PWI domain-containing protein isoform X2 [Iris pallida]|uniref:Splicing factor PWI domain-containing protein isoform X2 n=1 Tax=Iris pallida TaxID=29817 RepID=A0AAX6IL15_IRIPA|nr:splicing factor PWI domain-containing protein isoform X2 [Iris pallida]
MHQSNGAAQECSPRSPPAPASPRRHIHSSFPHYFYSTPAAPPSSDSISAFVALCEARLVADDDFAFGSSNRHHATLQNNVLPTAPKAAAAAATATTASAPAQPLSRPRRGCSTSPTSGRACATCGGPRGEGRKRAALGSGRMIAPTLSRRQRTRWPGRTPPGASCRGAGRPRRRARPPRPATKTSTARRLRARTGRDRAGYLGC